jgi:hypothetical protein
LAPQRRQAILCDVPDSRRRGTAGFAYAEYGCQAVGDGAQFHGCNLSLLKFFESDGNCRGAARGCEAIPLDAKLPGNDLGADVGTPPGRHSSLARSYP